MEIFGEEVTPSTVTLFMAMEVEYDENHFRRDARMLYFSSLLIRMAWFTLSNAFDIYIKIASRV